MKGARIRYQQTGGFHFLTFSCYRRRPYLSTVAAMKLFEDALERVRLRFLLVVAGYVVMPEHACPSGCGMGSASIPPRSPKARDRGHPQLEEQL
jgi:hypothetical protein